MHWGGVCVRQCWTVWPLAGAERRRFADGARHRPAGRRRRKWEWHLASIEKLQRGWPGHTGQAKHGPGPTWG
jgi:hypothetical protein